MKCFNVFKALKVLPLVGVIGCSQVNPGGGSGDSLLSFDVKKKVLDNGLTILVVENHKLPVFSYYTYYKVGSKFEDPDTTGSSHLLEHMMFKGAKKYGEGEFDKMVEGNGGNNNAYTTNDLTVYYENLPSQHFATIADLEADRMQNLLLADDSFKKEVNVVLEERKMRYENSDRGKIYLEMMKNLFVGTPYGSSVIGEIKDLKSITRKRVHDYFKTYYVPNNAVIVIVGDLKAEKVFEQINKSFGAIPANKNLDKIKADHLAKKGFAFQAELPKDVRLKGTSPLPMFSLAYKGIKIGPRDSFVLDILSSIIGGGESSYLSKKFVVGENPKLQGIYAANYTLQESGVFFIGGAMLNGGNRAQFKGELIREVRKSCRKAISKKAVQKVVNQYLVEMLSGLETNAGVARFIGDREVYFGSYEFYKDEINTYRSVTVEELESACQKYLADADSLFLTIWNQK